MTKYRKQLLGSNIADDVKQKIFDICKSHNREIIVMETDKDHIHFPVSYDTTDKICDIVKTIKQETTHCLWVKYNSFLSTSFGLMVILLVVLGKYRHLQFKSTSKAKGNG